MADIHSPQRRHANMAAIHVRRITGRFFDPLKMAEVRGMM